MRPVKHDLEYYRRRLSWRNGEIKNYMLSLVESGILDMRTLNCAANQGITKLEDFAKYTDRELLWWPNFGYKSLEIVSAALESKGLTLKASDDIGDPELGDLVRAAKATRMALRDARSAHQKALKAVERRRIELGHLTN